MSARINFDEVFGAKISKKQQKKNAPKHFLGIQHPFRQLVVGPSGCGKTNTIFEWILKYQGVPDKLIYVAKNIYEDKLQGLAEYLNTNSKGEEKEEPVMELMDPNQFMEEIEIDDFDVNDKTIMVFDDAISYPKVVQEKIADVFIRGRKNGISPIYISHRYFDTPKVVRGNATQLVSFCPTSAKEKNMIVNEMAQRICPERMKELLRLATEEPYNFLFVDHSAPHNNLHIRRNFDEFAILKK